MPTKVEGTRMSVKSASLAAALRAVVAVAAFSGAVCVAAPAMAQVSTADQAAAQLAQAIESAAIAAAADARAQGLSTTQAEAVAAAAMEGVIAQSGADSGVILAALSIASRDLALRNDAVLSLALNMVGRELNGGLVAPGVLPGHGTPPGGSPPPTGGGGGAEYRPPVH